MDTHTYIFKLTFKKKVICGGISICTMTFLINSALRISTVEGTKPSELRRYSGRYSCAEGNTDHYRNKSVWKLSDFSLLCRAVEKAIMHA